MPGKEESLEINPDIHSFQLKQRAQLNISVVSINVVKTSDFINSLHLEEEFINLLRRKKSRLSENIYSFEIGLMDTTINKSTLKWT